MEAWRGSLLGSLHLEQYQGSRYSATPPGSLVCPYV